MRFEQKFKDYRMAFRHFDVNFDGTVEFHEFIGGLESCGINMPYSDYRLVWDLINYDGAKEITFSKFCLINMDKSNNVLDLIKSTIKNNDQLQKYLQEVQERKYYGDKGLPLAAELEVTSLPQERHRIMAKREQRRPKPYALSQMGEGLEFVSKNKDIETF
jgi:hypothetical protein